jgi:hypothetical protein
MRKDGFAPFFIRKRYSHCRVTRKVICFIIYHKIMPIYKGDKMIRDVFIADEQMNEVYFENTLVYRKGDPLFVCTGDSASALYSGDGISWNRTGMPAGGRWTPPCYGGGKFVSLNKETDTGAYTTDGIHWDRTTLPHAGAWRSIAYGGGRFAAVGDFNASYPSSCLISEDGVSWQSIPAPNDFSDMYPRSIAYGHNRFVAGGYQRDTFCLLDGATVWTRMQGGFTDLRTICLGNGKFVCWAGGYYDRDITVSTDGINWTLYPDALPFSGNLFGLAYGNGRFVFAQGNQDFSPYSYDGISWLYVRYPNQNAWYSIAYGAGKFVAASCNTPAMAYSMDGANWTQVVVPQAPSNTKFVCSNGR